MRRVREDNLNSLANWEELYLSKESVERWTMWHDDDLVTKFCAILPVHARVLDVGVGGGFAELHICERRPDLRFSGLDFSLNVLDYLRDHSPVRWDTLVHGDALARLPFPDRAYDVVMCCELLEHVEDPSRLVGELARVAARMVVITVPNQNAVETDYHVWSFSEGDVRDLLSPHGDVMTIIAHHGDTQIIGVCEKCR